MKIQRWIKKKKGKNGIIFIIHNFFRKLLQNEGIKISLSDKQIQN